MVSDACGVAGAETAGVLAQARFNSRGKRATEKVGSLHTFRKDWFILSSKKTGGPLPLQDWTARHGSTRSASRPVVDLEPFVEGLFNPIDRRLLFLGQGFVGLYTVQNRV